MSFLVRDMIEQRLFTGARIVAGHRGSRNVMRWVNIMEILDMPGSVQEHELLITTAYKMEDELRHKDLLAHLKARGACGIAIQPGYYISAIPTYILREADRLDFPVIELPHDLTFSHITHVLLDCIAASERGQLGVDKSTLLLKLAQWEKSVPVVERGTIAEGTRCLLWLVNAKPDAGDSAKARQLVSKAKQCLQQKGSRVFTYAQAGGTLLYTQGVQADVALDVLMEVNLLLCEAGREEKVNLIGGAKVLLPGQSAQEGLDNALEAAATMKDIGAKRGLCPCPNMRLYKMMAALCTVPATEDEPSSLLRKLLAYDKEHNTAYVATLRAYLFSEGNACACAQRLYIHRHTLKNRLSKIDELCGVSLSDYNVRLQLSMELMMYDIY